MKEEIKKILNEYEILDPYPDMEEALKNLKEKNFAIISDEGTPYYCVIILEPFSNKIESILVNTNPTYKVTKDGITTWYEGGEINDEIRELLPFLKRYISNIWIEDFADAIIDYYYETFYENIKNLVKNLMPENDTDKTEFLNELENFFINGMMPDKYQNQINTILKDFFFERLTPKKEKEIINDIIDELKS